MSVVTAHKFGGQFTWASADQVSWNDVAHTNTKIGNFASNIFNLSATAQLLLDELSHAGKHFDISLGEVFGVSDGNQEATIRLDKSRIGDTYSWAEASGVSWSSPAYVDTPIGDFGPNLFNFHKSQRLRIGAWENVGRLFSTSASEHFAMFDDSWRRISPNFITILTVNDQLKRKASFRRAVAESFAVGDFQCSREFVKSLHEILEAAQVADWRSLTANSHFKEVIDVATGTLKNVSCRVYDSLQTSDARAFKSLHEILEAAQVADWRSLTANKTVSSSFAATDALDKDWNAVYTTYRDVHLNISDSKTTTRVAKSSLNIASLIGSVATFERVYAEAVSTVSVKNLGVSKLVAELANVNTTLNRTFFATIDLHDSIMTSDSVVRSAVVYRLVMESIAVADKIGNQAVKRFVDIVSAVSISVEKTFFKSRLEFVDISHAKDGRSLRVERREALRVADAMQRRSSISRDVFETIFAVDVAKRTQSRTLRETIRAWDAITRADGLAVSDMRLSTGDVTMADFIAAMEFGGIPGYSKWRDFIAGDYDYQRAVFRAILSSRNSDRGLLTNIQAVVDVPDIIDGGSATIQLASIGARVNFSREYHVVPEITLATKGGMGEEIILPFVDDADLLGFTAFMKKQSGELVEGVFAWSAKGI